MTYIETTDKRRLRVVTFSIKYGRQKGTVIFLPGMSDRLERYADLFSQLIKRDFSYASLDWYGQGGSVSASDSEAENIRPTFDINQHIGDLDEFLHRIIYTDFPPPYYFLGYDMGCLIAIAGLDVINNQCNRFIGISPLFTPLGYKIGSFQDKISQTLKDFGLGRIKLRHQARLLQTDDLTAEKAKKEDNGENQLQFALPDRRLLADVFNAAKYAKQRLQKNDLRFPAFFITGHNDRLVNPCEIRHFSDKVRLADTMTLFGAGHDIFHGSPRNNKQFWALFDAFIPGSNAYQINH